MIKAEQMGITPEALTTMIRTSHEQDFSAFSIHYDSYYTTHSPENKAFAYHIYERLQANGDIIKQTIHQAYDPLKEMFLPDRYIKGACPRCKVVDQYGDHCEKCGATYSATELINPISILSGATPIEKPSEHYFFNLPRYTTLLREWIRNGHLQEEITNKLDEWFHEGLKAWDISRDAPYFGFLIPGTKNKYFYVWLDAPMGYMASFQKYCEQHELSFSEYWDLDSTTELYHFVGKDIIYFHALFWPAILAGSGYRLPTGIFTHGFLTINGQKMSKSRGTFIEAKAYLEHLEPEYLRYYFAAKMNGQVEDIDLNFDDFASRINSDLVGKIVNIASRCAKFINDHFEDQLANQLHQPLLHNKLLDMKSTITQAYVERDYARAVRLIMTLATSVNQYIDDCKPWVLAKKNDHLLEVQSICSMGLNLFRILIAYLKPILPQMTKAVETFLNCPPITWDNVHEPLLKHKIHRFVPLAKRVEQANIDALLTTIK